MAAARAAWRTDPAGVGGVNPERLVFLDQCGVLTNIIRGHPQPRSDFFYRIPPSPPLRAQFSGVRRTAIAWPA